MERQIDADKLDRKLDGILEPLSQEEYDYYMNLGVPKKPAKKELDVIGLARKGEIECVAKEIYDMGYEDARNEYLKKEADKRVKGEQRMYDKGFYAGEEAASKGNKEVAKYIKGFFNLGFKWDKDDDKRKALNDFIQRTLNQKSK